MTRNDEIVAAYEAGDTITSLAKLHGVSRQRINAMVRRAGCPHRKPLMAENRARVEKGGYCKMRCFKDCGA